MYIILATQITLILYIYEILRHKGMANVSDKYVLYINKKQGQSAARETIGIAYMYMQYIILYV